MLLSELPVFIHDLTHKSAPRSSWCNALPRCATIADMADIEIYQPVVSRDVNERSIRGVQYAINEWGDASAPLLIYLHGWGDTGSTFQFVVDQLSDDWHVVAPDWRGFGRTRCSCSSYWFPDYLADLNELLAIYSPNEPARLVGHSMGANVGALYAGTMPERVSAYVNIEGFGLTDSDATDAPARYRDWLQAMDEGPRFGTYPDFAALAARVRSRSPRMSEAAAEFVAREWGYLDDGVIRIRADPRHKLPNPVLYRRDEARACWAATTAEVLVVTGTHSNLARHVGTEADAMYPDAARETIADAGHMLHFEASQSLADAIGAFLRPTL